MINFLKGVNGEDIPHRFYPRFEHFHPKFNTKDGRSNRNLERYRTNELNVEKDMYDTCDTYDTITTDVVVIGAGYSGIRAAAVIKEESDLDVVVLEASNGFGGRAKSGKIGGWKVEMGPKWLYDAGNITKENHPVTHLYQLNGFETGYDKPKNYTLYGYNEKCKNMKRKLYSSSRKLQKIRSYIEEKIDIEKEEKEKMARFIDKVIQRRLVDNQHCFEKVSEEELETYRDLFYEVIMPCVGKEAKIACDDTYDIENEKGLLSAFVDCGYDSTDPYDFFFKWFNYDWATTTEDGSILNFWNDDENDDSIENEDSIDLSSHNTVAKGMLSKSLQKYAKQNKISPTFRHAVERIWYEIKEGNGIRAKLQVRKLKGKKGHKSDGCVIYKAKRIISTVSAGVYNNKLIDFIPPLKFPEETYNPMQVGQQFQVFYQFKNKFWDEMIGNDSFFFTVSLDDPDGVSVSWWNLDREGMMPGSKIIMLDMVTKAFGKFVGKNNMRRKRINKRKLRSLLKPLKILFGDKYENPKKMIYSDYHSNKDYGYGAFSYWKKGVSPTNYFNFWGRYDFGDYIRKCRHNGCNGPPKNKDTEWILYLSGAASCLDWFETMDGAWHSGEISAKLMMESLGIKLSD